MPPLGIPRRAEARAVPRHDVRSPLPNGATSLPCFKEKAGVRVGARRARGSDASGGATDLRGLAFLGLHQQYSRGSPLSTGCAMTPATSSSAWFASYGADRDRAGPVALAREADRG